MKFFRKHKKKVLALCLSAVLLSCFMGFSISSSAANVSGSVTIDDVSFWAVNSTPSWFGFAKSSDNIFTLSISGDVAPEPYFNYIYLSVSDVPSVPNVEGRVIYLSLSVDLDVLLDNSLRWAYENNGDVLASAAFRNCQFYIGSTSVSLESYVLRAPDGSVIDRLSEDFWVSHAQSGYNIEVNILVDITSYSDTDLSTVWFYFPGAFSQEGLWGSSYDDIYQFKVNSVSLDYVYKPFNDVVQDDLADIKGSLSGVNNKLDSISSSMNTIDQDVNRVNQTVSDLKDSFEDFQDDLTTPNTDISSSNSQLQDKITDVQDQISSIDKEVNDAVDGVLDKVPGAENPFVGPDVPVLGDIWAKQFIDDLWGFIKSYSILYTFIHTGLLFCLASFILRR